MYRLVALDLDDTLLGRDGLISPEHKAALAAARARGCEVTLVTARSWKATERFAQELEVRLPVICMTGAAVYSPAGELLHQAPLPLDAARLLASRADQELWSMRLYFPDGRIITSRIAEDFMTKTGAHYPAEFWAGDLLPYLEGGESSLQVVCVGNRSVEGALACLPLLPDLVHTTYERYTPHSRTHIMHRSVSKGSALAALCERLGIAREAVIAMGDGEPDRSMIAWAGAGVAMGWASPELQAAADLVTSPDEAHPVAAALAQLMAVR